LAVVLAILVVIAALVVPNLGTMFGDTKVSSAADLVRARWTDARSRAQEEGRPYKFAVQMDTGKFRLAPDSPEFWGNGANNNTNNSDHPALILEDVLPKNVVFAPNPNAGAAQNSSGGNDSDWSHAVIFFPDGTASDDYNICFNAQGSRPIMLQLRGVTGSVDMTFPENP
jgi:Tfp pilus assembly protein FimT